jgi:hypothetical protein
LSASNAISSSSRTATAAARPRNAESSSSIERARPERFSLDGPSVVLDARLNAYRRDIADVGLAGVLFAPHYARPLIRACGMMPAGLFSEASDSSEPISQLLPGERFAVLDITAGWAWGYCLLDHRVGYVEAIELADPLEPTHIVCEASAPVQTCGDPLSTPIAHLPMGARLHGEARGAMLQIEGGCVPLSYLRQVGEFDTDPIAVAQRLLGAPYLRGGRTAHGIDCSGLVQLSLQLCGIPCPRDVADQRALGEPLAAGAPLARGDLLFCEDHVGLMVDDRMAIQVSHEGGKVAVEPFACAHPTGSPEGLERRRLT